MKRNLWLHLPLLALLAASSCSTYAGGIRVDGVIAPERDYDTVNGRIEIGAHSEVGDLDSVNGGIEIGADSRAGDIDNVNGGIRLGERVQVKSLDNVNGGVEAGAQLRVTEDIESVNGGVELGRGAQVDGGISAVNGGVKLEAAQVTGPVEINNGTLDTGRDSRLQGGIVVRKSKGWNGDKAPRPPRVIVGPGSVVSGEIVLEREAEVWVHQTAQIGKVRGGAAQRYSGERP